MGLSDEELAAEFTRRAAFVDAHALLKDERVSNTGGFHTNEEPYIVEFNLKEN